MSHSGFLIFSRTTCNLALGGRTCREIFASMNPAESCTTFSYDDKQPKFALHCSLALVRFSLECRPDAVLPFEAVHASRAVHACFLFATSGEFPKETGVPTAHYGDF